jgi:sulfite exporter TauE/SafE
MCAPLVFAFPAKADRFSAHLFYHSGRVFTYAMVGALMGSLGVVAAQVASATGADYLTVVARIQTVFSLVAGAFLLVFGLSQLGIVREPPWLSIATPERIPGYKRVVRSALRGNSALLMFVTGMLMGLLPCGLSFAAFSRALALGGPGEGFLLLLAFGCSTVPGLMLIGGGASVIARRYRRHFDLISGVIMIAMAVSLIVKALAAIL